MIAIGNVRATSPPVAPILERDFTNHIIALVTQLPGYISHDLVVMRAMRRQFDFRALRDIEDVLCLRGCQLHWWDRFITEDLLVGFGIDPSVAVAQQLRGSLFGQLQGNALAGLEHTDCCNGSELEPWAR